ncbi:MAG: DUF134 domain-containing protein [Candidatus Heimdallarchaeaceae archaeon]
MSNNRETPGRNSDFYYGKGTGRGYGRGQGRGPGRGRGRGRPPIAYPVHYDTKGRDSVITIEMSSFEFQILQLADNQDLTQNEIAAKLNISQTSVWRYLRAVRSKIAKAIAENNQIQIVIID